MPNKGGGTSGKSKAARGVVHFTGQFDSGVVTDKRKKQARYCDGCGKRLTTPKLIHAGKCRQCSACA